MGQIPVRLNTQGMAFPLLSDQSGRTVIDGRGDLTYVKGISSDGDVPQDSGTPGAFYAHNIMPSTYGWQSVEFEQIIPPLSSGSAKFVDINIVQGATVDPATPGAKPVPSNFRTYIATVFDAGQTYLYFLNGSNTWQILTVEGAGTLVVVGEVRASVAQVNGISYILLPGATSPFVLDVSAGVLLPRPFTGLIATDIQGIISSNGYIIVWTATRVLWSSTIDVEDFVPSDVTDAGGGGVQEASGAIIYCRPTTIGFLVFTDINCVSSVYTGNSKFPFEFKDISSAGGVFNSSLVSKEDAAGYIYAYTTSGIQRIAHTGAANVLTSITDFISGRVFEDFDETTMSFSKVSLTTDMGRAIEVISNRYVTVSYAQNTSGIYSHAIIVDAMQHRLGKIKLPHSAVFSYKKLVSNSIQDARSQIAFLQTNGAVQLLKFSINSSTAAGVLLFGKLQYMHQRMLQLQEVEVENADKFGNFSLYDFISYDGKTLMGPVEGYQDSSNLGRSLKIVNFSNVAKSHSLLMVGSFDILSLLIHVNVHGIA